MQVITNEPLWQIGTGDYTRDYSKMCLDFGIAIVGPGWPGDARKTPPELVTENDWGIRLTQIKVGDVVLLRRGQTLIKAVGRVTKDYDYSLSLSDIHGWDLNHYITLEWLTRRDGQDIVLPHAMIGYSSMSAIGKNYDAVKEIVNSQELIPYRSERKLSDLRYPGPVTIDDLKDHLIEHGIRIADAENTADTIARIITLVKWYNKNYPNVLEHELRAFMVIPLLMSLGWSEQKMKLEYDKIDIALFNAPYTKHTKDQPEIIIETKTFEDGLLLAKEQLNYYAGKYPTCRTMVTTNGYRYNVYKKDADSFGLRSYFNLLDMRRHDYIENHILGALDGVIQISNL